MQQWKRLFYYLMINVLVSACTTLAVLVIWDQTRSPLAGVAPLLDFNFAPARAEQSATPTTGPAAALATATPAFAIHSVEAGDTFDSIAAQYGVSKEDIIAANGFTQDQPLGEGEMIRVPLGAGVTVTGPQITILVVGPGDLELEQVELQQVGAGVLSLQGWELSDDDGNVFAFPGLELSADGARVSVYTKAGTDSAERLFWGQALPVWESGDVVRLVDDAGEEVDSYLVP
jgi:LysM repeat protein